MTRVDRRSFLGSSVACALWSQTGYQDRGEELALVDRPRTRFAVNTEIWWSKLPLVERIKKTAEHGFPAIEFWPWRNKDQNELERTCKDLGIEAS